MGNKGRDERILTMKILAVDTSSQVAAVAVLDGNKLLGEYLINHKMEHSKKLMPMIIELMKTLELKPGDIDVYAASTGPGSFTGLRIGVTTVKAMAYAAQKPVIGIPALDGLAFNIPVCASLVCPIMDARNGQVYTAIYKKEMDRQVKLTEYMGIHISDLIPLIKGRNHNTVFVGDAVYMHRDYLKKELREACEFAPPHLVHQRASSIAQIALERASAGELEDCFGMVPFYLRKSQAEREHEGKRMEQMKS